MASEADYNELEVCLQQAQAEIGAALSSLSLDYNSHAAVTSGYCDHREQQVVVADSNANPVQPVVCNKNETTFAHITDFVSIFAANNLVSDGISVDGLYGDLDQSTWHFTLPANFQRKKSPPERPRTLTPPCTKSDKKRFRKRDWKFYVHGKYKSLIPVQKKHEYGFSPIKEYVDNAYFNKDNDQLKPRYRTEIVIVDKVNNANVDNLNNSNYAVEDIDKKVSELQINLGNSGFHLCNNTINSSSSDGSDKHSSNQPSDLSTISSSSTRSPLSENKESINNQDPDIKSGLTKQHFDSDRNFEVATDCCTKSVLGQNELMNNLMHDISDNTLMPNEMNVKESYNPSAFSPVVAQGYNKDIKVIQSNNDIASFEKPVDLGLKSPVLRRPAIILCNNNNNVQHESTMTRQLSIESSSTSDSYYRESSLSPVHISSPDFKTAPTFVIPAPPALDKHEARLKLSGRSSSNNARSKSSDRKSTKKRSKSKDGKTSARDSSPSKTERSREGKISCATQTHRSAKNYKPLTNHANSGKTKDEDSQNPKCKNKSLHVNNKVKTCDSFDNDVIYTVPVLPMPVSKRAAMESSTSSDESGDYKKVNITALRERFIQSRKKKKVPTATLR